MKPLVRDPLLAIARSILVFLITVLGLVAAMLLVGSLAPFVFGETFQRRLAEEGAKLDFAIIRLQVCFVLLLMSAMLAMIVRICWLLLQMVRTVKEGDPFIPDNAGRLTQMAWLTLAIQLIGMPIAALATWLHSVTEGAGADVGTLSVKQGFDMDGLLLMLILFILARVFRKGAEMRDDLEGMV